MIHKAFEASRDVPRGTLAVALLLIALAAIGCGAPKIDNPMVELREAGGMPARQVAAMQSLDSDPDNEEYLAALHRIIWRPGYSVAVRKEAFDRLRVRDEDGLKRTIRQRLPQMQMWEWLTELCSLIADHGWTDLSPALVSSWARPNPMQDDRERPEYLALVRLFGEDQVADVVFAMFVESSKVSEQGLRTRCWNLLHRLGYRDRLVALLESSDIAPDDLMLIDLRAGAEELGIVPETREEILWLRKLREPEHAAFWSEARAAVQSLSPQRRASLEMRDLPILVSAMRHQPELLELSETELYSRVLAYNNDQKHYATDSNFGGWGGGSEHLLQDHREVLTWGDLVGLCVLVRALEVRQVVDHLFNYADRDKEDESTEYGGVIRLDDQGRYEIVEFPPRIREHDNRFNASQEMLDAAYTALFHFHNHVQEHRNNQYAGPGFGDLNYADNLRANCVVLTFVSRDDLNVDFYRHGRVRVDLGVIHRSQ